MMAMLLTTAPNFRDLGGMPTADGRTVRERLIFRSEAVLEPTDDDAEMLEAMGIVLVCDLRSGTERDHAPNAWWADRGIERLDLDVLAQIRTADGPWSRLKTNPDETGARAAMHGIFAAMPAAAAPHLATILTRIAAGDLPLLIHCTAGKDRTGFISAMILSALGVSHEDIVADYLASAGRRTARATEHTRVMVLDRVGPMVSEQALEALMGVDRSYIESSFTAIRDSHGSIDRYLAAAGLDEGVLTAVRARLLG